MTVVNLGVIDQPYSFSENVGKVKTGKNKGKSNVSMTGDVAEILEEKYGVMQFFFDRYEKEIMASLEEGLQGAFESMLMGAPVNEQPFAAGCSEVEDMFKRFLEAKEMDGQANGVPTKASLMGVSHRFKSKRGPVRPSFIDTGLYENSFKCWVE